MENVYRRSKKIEALKPYDRNKKGTFATKDKPSKNPISTEQRKLFVLIYLS